MYNLTSGILKRIVQLEPEQSFSPQGKEQVLLQITYVKQTSTNTSKVNICSVSDGEFEVSERFLFNKPVLPCNIVKIDKLSLVTRSGQILYVVKNFEVVNDNTTTKIGNPQIITRPDDVGVLERSKQKSKMVEDNKRELAIKYSNIKSGNNNNSNSNSNSSNNINNKSNNNKNQINNKTNINSNDDSFSNNNNDYEEDPALQQYFAFKDLMSFTENFVLLVRVTSITDKSYNNKKNEPGKLRAYTLLDSKGEEVEIVVFNKQIEQFQDKLLQGRIYEISRAEIVPNNNRRKNGSSDLSIRLIPSSIVSEVTDDKIIRLMPQIGKMNFVNLSEIAGLQNYAEVDVVVVVTKIFPIENKVFKNGGGNMMKRVKIVSVDKHECDLTLFGKEAETLESLNPKENDIMIFTRLMVKEYMNAKTLNTGKNTVIINNLQEIAKLAGNIYNKLSSIRNGDDGGLAELTRAAITSNKIEYSKVNSRIIAMISQANIMMFNDLNKQQPMDAYRLKVTVFLPFEYATRCVYPACPGCKKKLIDQGNDSFSCVSCKKDMTPSWTWMLSIRIKDTDGQTFVSVFGNPGDKIMGMTADEFVKQRGDDKFKESLRSKVNFSSAIVVVRPKIENYAGSGKLKYNALSVISFRDKQERRNETVNLIETFEKMYLGKK